MMERPLSPAIAENLDPEGERRFPWLRNVVRPLLLALMAGSAALSLAELLETMLPAWQGRFLVLAAILGAVAGYAVFQMAHESVPSASERAQWRGLVLAISLLLVKSAGYFAEVFEATRLDIQPGAGGGLHWLLDPWVFSMTWLDKVRWAIAADLHRLALDPLSFFDLGTILSFVCFGVAWRFSVAMATDFLRIGVQSQDRDERPPLDAMTRRVLALGGVLIALSGLARLEISELLNLERPPVPGLIGNVLGYFVLALILLGQTHLVVRLQIWRREKVTVSPGLPGRWLRYGMIFLALAALAAFILPTGYAIPLLDLGRLLIWLVTFIATLVVFLIHLFFLPLVWLYAWLTGGPQPSAPSLATQPLPQAAPPGPETAAAPSPELLMLRALIFIVLLVGMLLYLLRSYLRDHPALAAQLRNWRPVRRLLRGLLTFWQGVARLFRRAGALLPSVLRRDRDRAEDGLGHRAFRRWFRSRSSRQRVIDVYLETLVYAGEHGAPRKAPQTPREYAGRLEARIPGAGGILARLTGRFSVARYSRRVISTQDAIDAEAEGEAFRRALDAYLEGEKTEGRAGDV